MLIYKRMSLILLIHYFLDEHNEEEFDEALLRNFSKEFTTQYLKKYQIDFGLLEKENFSIPLSSFIALFMKKNSKILSFIIQKIDRVWIDTDETAMLALVPKKYRKGILSIASLPAKKPTLKELEYLRNCLPNSFITISLRDSILKESEKNSYYYYYLGMACFSSTPRQISEAETHLLKAIELNPQSEFAYAQLAKVQTLQKKYNEAEKNLHLAIKINPKYALAFNILGEIASIRTKREEAVAYYRKAAAYNPKNFSSTFNLGRLLKNMGRFVEAEGYLRRRLTSILQVLRHTNSWATY